MSKSLDSSYSRRTTNWQIAKNCALWLTASFKISPPHNSAHVTLSNYRADIDGLRAIAVLSAVGFHAFPSWVKGGFTGVDIFFVISGFLISTIIFSNLERNSFSFFEFYSRRIKRIFPALLLVLAASFTIGWFVLLAPDFKQLGKHIAAGAGFVSNIVLWQESGYFDNTATTKPLLHLWSLGIEEQFYIIWPLLLWLGWKKRLNLLYLTLVIAIISFTLNIKGIYSDAIATFYSPQTRFWELLMGSTLAYTTLYKPNLFAKVQKKIDSRLVHIFPKKTPEQSSNKLRNIQSILGIILLLLGIFVVTKESNFPGWIAILPTLGTVLIISAGTQAWLNRTVLSNRVFVWFGLISYPLYLWHWSLLSFTHILGINASREVRIAAVLISMVLAWLTYSLLEKPMRFGKHNKEKTITLAVLMAIIGCIGYNCYKQDGFGKRFPPIIQEITEYSYDYEKEYRYGTCFLRPEQSYKALNTCKTTIDESKRTILLWGDSHAAHLYPGYKAVFGEKFNIVQRTASLCPPIRGMSIKDRPYCREINGYTFQYIKEQKPDIVVLAALWMNYDWKQIETTVVQLRKIGVQNIYLVGHVPQWNDTLPKQLYAYFKSDILKRVPDKMKFGLKQHVIYLEPIISSFTHDLGINYISPYDILCDDLGCITKLGETGDTLISWDYAHLTGVGSRYLVSKFPHN